MTETSKENEMNVPVTLDNDSGDSWLIVRRAVDHALPSDTSMLGDYRVRDNLASSLLDYLTTPRLHKPEEPDVLGAVVYSESNGKFWTRASIDPEESHVWAGAYDKCWFNWRQLPDDVKVVDPHGMTRGTTS